MDTFPDDLPLRREYGDATVPEGLSPPIKSFPHPTLPGLVCLHSLEVGGEFARTVHYCSAPHLYPWDDGVLHRRVVDVGPWHVPMWGERTEIQCHTTSRSHPWNIGQKRPGYHHCGQCGFPTWIEHHGVAAGVCDRCGYQG